MNNPVLHIVAFDVPFPPDYGGVIDIYYRIKALHDLGVRIHLHCFEYGRGQSNELEKITESVHYYPRKRRFFDSLGPLPFIVSSRRSLHLLNRLVEIDAPILFEGLHTTAFLDHPSLAHRTRLVRTHNIEHEYYHQLSLGTSGWKCRFFRKEAAKLKRYEPILKHATVLFPIKESDAEHFEQYDVAIEVLPPCFRPIESAMYSRTKDYALFHGNLSVPENEQGVRYLLESIGSLDGISLVIAGKDPSPQLEKFVSQQGATLVKNPDQEQMDDLLNQARVHLLPTRQSTGVKLKLMNALLSSGHIIANDAMVAGTGLEWACVRPKTQKDWRTSLMVCLENPLNEELFNERIQRLKASHSTIQNCKRMLSHITRK